MRITVPSYNMPLPVHTLNQKRMFKNRHPLQKMLPAPCVSSMHQGPAALLSHRVRIKGQGNHLLTRIDGTAWLCRTCPTGPIPSHKPAKQLFARICQHKAKYWHWHNHHRSRCNQQGDGNKKYFYSSTWRDQIHRMVKFSVVVNHDVFYFPGRSFHIKIRGTLCSFSYPGCQKKGKEADVLYSRTNACISTGYPFKKTFF